MHAAPGGPFNSERKLSAEVLANLQAKYGLDQPLYVQIWTYIRDLVLHFDFGPSFKYKDRTVNDIIAQGFPVTLVYGFWSFVIATILGIGAGVIAAIRQNTPTDYLVLTVAIIGAVLPGYVIAPILVLVFTLKLGWLPGGGWEDGEWRYLVLPVIALSTGYIASIARLMRSSMLENMGQDYVRTARAKGMTERVVVLKHVLRNSLIPVVTVIALGIPSIFGGAIITENLFGVNGIGAALIGAIHANDLPMVQTLAFIFAVLIVVFNLIADVLYGLLDPRIRYE
jgi:oligopeptide transport system permease protein